MLGWQPAWSLGLDCGDSPCSQSWWGSLWTILPRRICPEYTHSLRICRLFLSLLWTLLQHGSSEPCHKDQLLCSVLRRLSDDWMQFPENVCPELDVVRWREGACVTQWSGGFGAELYRMEPNYCLPVGLNLYDAVHACMDRLSVITEPIMTICVLCGVDIPSSYFLKLF